MIPEARYNNACVDRFAESMKRRLAEKNAEGRGGWWDINHVDPDELRRALIRKVVNGKGIPTDIAVYAMMIDAIDYGSTNEEIARCYREIGKDGTA
jgi:hypothetical protein